MSRLSARVQQAGARHPHVARRRARTTWRASSVAVSSAIRRSATSASKSFWPISTRIAPATTSALGGAAASAGLENGRRRRRDPGGRGRRRGAASRRTPAATPAVTASGPSVSLAILPFRNASGDPALAWLGTSLAEMLRTDVGQSAYLRTVSSDRLDQTLRDLRIAPDTAFDAESLRRLAEFTNADTVLWGQYLRVGGQIRIDATFQDYKRQRTIPLKVEAPSESELLKAIDELARSIQANVACVARRHQGAAGERRSNRRRRPCRRFATTTKACRWRGKGRISRRSSASSLRRAKIPSLRSPTRGWPRPMPISDMTRKRSNPPDARST